MNSRVAVGTEDFLSSECVSCGACVQACPTATLNEKSIIEIGTPDRTVLTTCAYCGVGCSFKAEMRGDQVVRMVPWKDGKANHGHSCVKGRFAWGYATHADRITKPMIRDDITDPWREVSWDEAIGFAAGKLKGIQKKYGRKSIGGITSSRCTNEEVWLVQKMIRAAFGNNNTDTCARVCHSPTGYGLKSTYGTSAGTQDFDSVEEADVILVIGANPTDAHPVFASQMKRRLRQGAKLIVADPRAIDLVRTAACRGELSFAALAGHQCRADQRDRPHDRDRRAGRKRITCASAATSRASMSGANSSPIRSTRLKSMAKITGVPAEQIRAAARLYATGGNAAIYYGLGVTEHCQGSTMVMGMANLAMATGNIGRRGVGVNPLRGQNNVQGSCDMGTFPHELPGYRPVGDDAVRGTSRRIGASRSTTSRASASRTCSMRPSPAITRACMCKARTSRSPIPTRSMSRRRCARSNA